ncbi:alpha/beta hydrolase-fold protein [Crossiella sp. SN42]|uniref:alpha/beta hydrolase n=1 Tax=Crossiella sp. SN42 TaxID=2944808 RepID=UPI00207C8709|nr:alpha/beta hydrolase-fold protein [Crossiella sp. SN42]MCO1576176.1 alpha/beta hydrolase-fold protein [Crossiella sp. SN42]
MTITSPALAALAGDPAALAEHLKTAGGPLVEPAPDNPGSVLVTFVWLGEAERVSIRAGQLFADHLAPSHALERLPGTDIWHRSTVVRADVTSSYQYIVDEPAAGDLIADAFEALRRQVDCWRADPFNPRRIYPQTGIIAGRLDLPEHQWDSILELPETEPAPWFTPAGAPAGTLVERRLTSAALGNERQVTVYRPPSGQGPFPLVVMLDGECWTRVADLPTALDNRIADGSLAPVVVAFVHTPEVADRPGARIGESTCNPALTTMLAEELPPLLAEFDVTTDPARTVLAGNSLTGLAAAFTALHRPEVYGNVLASSGSFWWGYADHPVAKMLGGKDGEPEWLTRQYAGSPRVPVRFWLDCGVLEAGNVPWIPGVDPRAANRHFRTVLRAKGNQVDYFEAPGGHEFVSFRRNAIRALCTLLPGAGA